MVFYRKHFVFKISLNKFHFKLTFYLIGWGVRGWNICKRDMGEWPLGFEIIIGTFDDFARRDRTEGVIMFLNVPGLTVDKFWGQRNKWGGKK